VTEPHGTCTEAIIHGPADRSGRCPWCREKVTHAIGRPERVERSDLSEAYELMYDPDAGALGRHEVEQRRRAGTLHY
jgi:hypothetical protein